MTARSFFSMFNYIYSAISTIIVMAAIYFIVGEMPSFSALAVGIVFYWISATIHLRYVIRWLVGLDRLSYNGNSEARKMLTQIVGDEQFIVKIIECSFSAILCVFSTIIGYFFLPFTILGFMSACFFSFVCQDMVRILGTAIREN